MSCIPWVALLVSFYNIYTSLSIKEKKVVLLLFFIFLLLLKVKINLNFTFSTSMLAYTIIFMPQSITYLLFPIIYLFV